MRSLKYWSPKEKLALSVWFLVGLSLLTAIATNPHPEQKKVQFTPAYHMDPSPVATPSPVKASI